MKINKLKLFSLILVFGLSFSASFSGAEETKQNVKADLPQEAVNKVDEAKLENAKELTIWLNKTLQEKKALVAIVARMGGPDVVKHDRTGMAHSGLAIYDPRAQTWILYNLVNKNSSARPPLSALYRTAPLDFFYGQAGYKKNALILIPDQPTQKRIYEAVLNGKYKSLFFTDKYNLLSVFNSNQSLNCNKWLLMNIVAARIDNYDINTILNTITQGFEPGLIRLSSLEKIFAKKKPNIRPNEMPSGSAPIKTVTIQSLYDSKFFTDKLFYSDSQTPNTK